MSGNYIEFTYEEVRKILKQEFLVQDDLQEIGQMERALSALEIYENREDFLEKTGWGRDNPDCSSEEYLTENRICRWINGKFMYLSRIVWDVDEERM